jgi:rhodanese-related sulfurtransferase/uncharacterized membrane protein (DUF485 family)
MSPFPLPLTQLIGQWPSFLVYLMIGMAFGYVLEIGGFGNSTKLAAQFYFRDLTVLKVMFGAIITAMVLLFLASGIGLMEFNLVWVNPTYLWPGIVGGLIMGVGFILGGFCPGTSLVAAATGKVDGIFFVLGAFTGIFFFGETVNAWFQDFWYSSYMGRFMLPEWLGLPTGVVVLLIVLMALFMFWGAEKLESAFGGKDLAQEPRWRYGAAGGVVVLALAGLVIGQPTSADRWARLQATDGVRLAERRVQAHPGEVLAKIHDRTLNVILLDVRSEADYNLFHIQDARHTPLDRLPSLLPELREQPANTLFMVIGNDEEAATAAWKLLRAESVPNVYLLEGGINGWIRAFADQAFVAANALPATGPDQVAFRFDGALGARYPFAEPNPHNHYFEYVPIIELDIPRAPSGGGCG